MERKEEKNLAQSLKLIIIWIHLIHQTRSKTEQNDWINILLFVIKWLNFTQLD